MTRPAENKIRSACVLGRIPCDGMKPTFRHRRPENTMPQHTLESDKEKPQICQAGSAEAFLDFLPLAGNAVIFSLLFVPVNRPFLSLSALRSNGERAGVRCCPNRKS
jgi:hypothetical protein